MSWITHRTWGMESDRENWQRRGFCRDVDPELMWPMPRDEAGAAAAAQVCVGCPVAAKCLEDGVEIADYVSVRAGYTGHEREHHRRKGLEPHQYPPPKRITVRACGDCRKELPMGSSRRLCSPCVSVRQRAVFLRKFAAEVLKHHATGIRGHGIARVMGYGNAERFYANVARAREMGLLPQEVAA